MDARHTEPKDKLMDFLEITNLNISYLTRRLLVAAVQDVSFSVKKGNPRPRRWSGSGKSTIGRAILGLLDEPGKSRRQHPAGDSIWLIQPPRSGVPRQAHWPHLSGPANLAEPSDDNWRALETIQTHLQIDARDARKRAIELLDDVGIINAETGLTIIHTSFQGYAAALVIALALCADGYPDRGRAHNSA